MPDRRLVKDQTFDIVYREIQPAPDLSWLVWHFWEMDVRRIQGETFAHRIVPDAGLSIVVLPGNRLFALGPRTQAIEVPVHQGDFFAGVRFHPGVAQSVFGLDTDECVEFTGLLEVISPKLASVLATSFSELAGTESQISILSSALKTMCVDPNSVDPILLDANHDILIVWGDIDAMTLANRLHVTTRRLQRLFKRWVGLSPKQVTRLRRFRSSATNLVRETPLSWAEVAAERGFSDQSHLIRDFTELAEGNPSLLSGQIGKIRHDGLDDA